MEQLPIADGTVSLNYKAVSGNRRDTLDAIAYYNVALPKCKTQDVGQLISHSPKPIVVKVERRAAVNSTVYQGEASDGAETESDRYSKLFLRDIVKDADNAVIDGRLVSKLNQDDRNSFMQSIEKGRPTQKVEVLIMRVARLSPVTADTLSAMIKQRKSNQRFLDTLAYEVTAADNISEWITFHNDPSIDVTVNLEKLGMVDSIANTPQKDFTRIMAHELLHHWWTHFKPFEKLKWKVIKDKQPTYGYRLSDGLVGTSSPQDSNQGCSMGPSHERHNPESKKVCKEQYDY